MAFGELSIAKTIAMNAPKYKRIIEPFGDKGTVALFPGMKKPKEHIVNIEDETIFSLMVFLQSLSSSDKKNLKSYDWVASPETFDAALSITAIEGADLFYKYFYLKQFGVKSKDPEQPPTFDFLKNGHDMSSMLFRLPLVKIGLKKVTLTNEDALSVVNNSGGSETFIILLPSTPEQIESIESKLSGISANVFYAKKSKSNEELFEQVDNSGDMITSTFSASSIMMATMEVRTNYEHKSANKLRVVEPIGESEEN